MAKDVAQRELDQVGFRITNLGDPRETGDATKTDNTAVPRANSGTGAPGTSFLASPADHVHPAVAVVTGGDGFIDISDPTYQTVKGKTEEVVAEFNVDLTGLVATRMAVAFSAVVKAVGGNATFNVRMGGTPGAPDGSVLSSFFTGSTVFITQDGTSFGPNPGRHQLIKLTAVTDADAAVAHIYGKTVEFRKSEA